jgi:hypothetical protein
MSERNENNPHSHVGSTPDSDESSKPIEDPTANSQGFSSKTMGEPATTSPTEATGTSFTYFPKLPIELRLLIWSFLLPSRVIEWNLDVHYDPWAREFPRSLVTILPLLLLAKSSPGYQRGIPHLSAFIATQTYLLLLRERLLSLTQFRRSGMF